MCRILSLGGFPMLILLLPQLVHSAGQGLVSPQSNCRIRCENGGMCVFDLDRPDFHSCICLLGVFSGDRCQFRIAAQEEAESTTVSSVSSPKYSTEDTRRLEEERRKQEYERVVEEKTRKEKEERERAQEEEIRRQKYWKEESARREKERHDAEKRHEEERARHEERRRQYEAERAREDERRREAETRRMEEEKKRKMEEEEERAREIERLRQEDEENQRKMTEKQAESINEQWEYHDEDGDEYPQVAEKDEYDEGMEEEMKNEGNEERIEQGDVKQEEEEELRPEDETVISAIGTVFEKAVEETIMEHPIEEEEVVKMEEEVANHKISEEVETDQDDYWDHTPKKTDEDYARDGEETKISKDKPEEIEEYGMEESQEGWMMVKKAEKNENGSNSTFNLILISVLLISLIF